MWTVEVRVFIDEKDFPTRYDAKQALNGGLEEMYRNYNISSVVTDTFKEVGYKR